MTAARVAFLTVHACPLAPPGQGKSGGMNVHVRQLARALGEMGILVDIFTRSHGDEPETIEYVGDCVRVVHLPAGEAETPLEELYGYLPQFLEVVEKIQRENGIIYQAIHSH